VAWALFDPIMNMIVMTIIFTAILGHNIPDFPVYLFTGIIVFQFFNQSSTRAMIGMVTGRGLLQRTYMPKSVFAIAAVGTGLVNFLFAFIPLVALAIIFRRPVNLSWLFTVPGTLLVASFTLGVGLVLSSLSMFFNDIHTVYGFLTQLLMWMSGIFYSVDTLPARVQWIIRANPLYHMIRLFRDPIYAGRFPSWSVIGYAALWSSVMFLIGFWIFTRFSDEYAYRL
jgi:ABC-type polysaccharide/polyol phosphate export permease